MKLSQDIIERLCFVKHLLNKAKSDLLASFDLNGFSSGILSMHDAIDNLLGAIAAEKAVVIQEKDTLTVVFSKILANKIKLAGASSDIIKLNNIRNQIKHNGIFPNIENTLRLVDKWLSFVDENTKKIFHINIQEINLSASIEDEQKKNEINAIYDLVKNKKYKLAMEKSGLAFFELYESKEFHTRLWIKSMAEKKDINEVERTEKYLFPDKDIHRLHLDLLEKGVDPYLYHRFKNLTPEYGYEDMITKKLICKKQSHTWNAGNWTKENSLFCIDWLVDYILKHQTKYRGYTVRNPKGYEEITFLEDTVLYKDASGSTILREFTKGEKVKGLVFFFCDGDWQDHGKAGCLRLIRVDINKDKELEGYLDKTKINVKEVFTSYEVSPHY